jgi:futalosine hydrolase
MKVVITSATNLELNRIRKDMKPEYLNGSKSLNVIFNVSGVGMLATCFSLTKLIYDQKPDLIIQAGIAGCFDSEIFLAEVVAVKDEVAGDIGVEENGVFSDLFDMNFQKENEFPFTSRNLVNTWLPKYNLLQLEEIAGITVNEISTRKDRIEQLRIKYKPVIESMEGAALHYVGLQTHVPFIQLRAISNYIGERDKSKWKFNEAFENLSNIIIRYLDMLVQVST